MAHRDIVAIGTSAGGVEALLFLARNLPPLFPAAVVVTIHLPSNYSSALDNLLTIPGHLSAKFAINGDHLTNGQMFIAPPGNHLIIEGETLTLGGGPRENNARPSIDVMLRSAAVCCAERSIGVVLTGTLGDGASGLSALSQCGGKTVVQDPKDASFPQMPLSALQRTHPDHVVPLADMPALLERLVRQPAGSASKVPDGFRYEVEIAKNGHSNMNDMDRIGRRSVLSCPDCGGVMWEIDENDLVRFRCHVGHAYTAEVMSLAMDEVLRRALAGAHRGYEERVALMEKMKESALANGHNQLADTWRSKADEYRKEVGVIAKAMHRMERLVEQEGG
jgi:two-component system, chemotaxis family, protein-glutamate methylesterase/glutaminase